MDKPIRRVGVVGAGVMGSGIAAHCANAGLRVELLDIVPPKLEGDARKDPTARSAFADGAIKKSLKAKPAPFFHRSRADLVRTGNLEDHLERFKDCDLVIEAIVERLEIKQSLFEKLEKSVGAHTIVASNTSGLRIESMLEGRSKGFAERFLVMHFFNPVRYMKLLEIVTGEATSEETLARVTHLGKEVLGKGIVRGKDTPNFVGNRIGVHSMMVTMHEMLAQGLSPEDVDAITGKAMAHPKSASFRTGDLVGIDTLVHVADHCHAALTDDEERDVFEVPSFIRTLVEKKLLGNKTKAGFYKKDKSGIQVFDPTKLEYRDKSPDEAIRKTTKSIAKEADPKKRIRKLIADDGKVGAFAWTVISRSLAYASRRIDEIADSITAVDDAMRWGYNWELGPFEVWDALGFKETAERMKKDGLSLPASIDTMLKSGAHAFYTDDGKVYELAKGDYVACTPDPRHTTLDILRRGEAPVLSNDGAEAWDLGDGVLGLRFKTKANTLDMDVINMLDQAAGRAEQDFEGLLIYNEGEHFCVGANLFVVAMAATQGKFDEIREVIRALQASVQRLKYAQVPVVAAPYGMTLGGGLEVCLACDAVQASAETYAGQVEVGVGIIPGGCGNLNLLKRALEGIPEGTEVDALPYVTQVFKNVALAKVATSADEAKHLGFFRHSDGVTFDRARHLHDAKARVMGMARSGYLPPAPRTFRLPGESGIATLDMMVGTMVDGGYATEHDALIARKLAAVLCGGPGGAARKVTEDEIIELERDAFVDLCAEQKSIDRMQHMLMHNKPLRN